MPFALIFVGLLLTVAAVRNTQDTLFTLVKGDFTGQANFGYWAAVILIVGTLGYIKPLRGLSTAFLVLLLVVIVLSKGNPGTAGGGLFTKFSSALGTTTAAPAASTTAASGGASTSSPFAEATGFLTSLQG